MNITQDHDERWMRAAVDLAKDAYAAGNRPFGCIIINDGQRAIGWGSGSETWEDPTAHSEITAIQMACPSTTTGRLQGCTLYSTHEPCPMCCGAIAHSKLSRVVWGSKRADFPEMFRSHRIPIWDRLGDTSTPPEMLSGVLREQCNGLFRQEIEDLFQAGLAVG